ncbi:Protein timeless [Orchesella cincta]|uniref:Protein timeless n=1 Tax=Orchesella cincta TaxID=48709 RepID=A0A1D2NBN0_ORCCI|nr:Protein timeless [Orchesella cincta]
MVIHGLLSRNKNLTFRGFVLKYAMAKVVCNYALLLQDWDTLKPLTLHCIVKMFHRFVFDMGYPALICQASLFLTFKKILEVADLRSDLKHTSYLYFVPKEVKTFFLHFWPKFVKLCEDKKMFIEILFWKTAREAQEIQDGYSDLRGPSGGASNKKSNWTSEEENELELLVELYNDAPEEVKKAQKLVDFIMERWTWRPKSKRLFMLKLVEKELVNPERIKRQGKQWQRKRDAPKTWGDEEIEKLRDLYEEHKDSTTQWRTRKISTTFRTSTICWRKAVIATKKAQKTTESNEVIDEQGHLYCAWNAQATGFTNDEKNMMAAIRVDYSSRLTYYLGGLIMEDPDSDEGAFRWFLSAAMYSQLRALRNS